MDQVLSRRIIFESLISWNFKPFIGNPDPMGRIVAIICVLILVPVGFVLKTGIHPKPIPIIDASRIETLEQAGVLAFRGLEPELADRALVVFGARQEIPQISQVRDGFLKASRAAGMEMAALSSEDGKSAKAVQEQFLKGKRVFLTLPDETLFGGGRKGGLNNLEASIPTTAMVVAIVPMNVPLGRCPRENVHFEFNDESFLPCAAAYMSNKTVHKKAMQSKNAVALERFGQNTYLIFLKF